MAREQLRLDLTARDRMSKVVKGTTSSFDKMARKIAAVAVAYVGFRAATRTASAALKKLNELSKQSIQLAGVQEVAEVKLAAAMRAAGIYTKEAYQANLDMASGFQAITTYGDEAVIALQAVLTNMGGLSGPIMDDAIWATLNLAQTWDMNLSAAGMQIAKAAGGYTSGLTRYGVMLDKTIPASEKFAAALDIINAKMGGAAVAQANTYVGMLKSLSDVWGDMLEDVGDYITKSPAVRAAIENMIVLIAGPGGLQESVLGATATMHSAVEQAVFSAYGLVIPMLEWVDKTFDEVRSLTAKVKDWVVITDELGLGPVADYFEKINRISMEAEEARKHQDDWAISIGKTKYYSDEARTSLDYLIMNLKQQRENLPRAIEKWEEYFKALQEGSQKPGGLGAGAEGVDFTSTLQVQNLLLQQMQFQYQDILTAGRAGLIDTRTEAQKEIDHLDQMWQDLNDKWAGTQSDMGEDTDNLFLQPVQSGMNMLSDRLVDAMFDAKTQFRDIWKAMYKEAMKEFFSKIVVQGLLHLAFPATWASPFTSGGYADNVPVAQHGFYVPGPSWDHRDNKLVRMHSGEAAIPREQTQRYFPVVNAMIQEARTGRPAFGGGEGGGAVHNHYYNIQTLDAESYRNAIRHGALQQETQLAIEERYLET